MAGLESHFNEVEDTYNKRVSELPALVDNSAMEVYNKLESFFQKFKKEIDRSKDTREHRKTVELTWEKAAPDAQLQQALDEDRKKSEQLKYALAELDREEKRDLEEFNRDHK